MAFEGDLFSFRSRENALRKFKDSSVKASGSKEEIFDLFVIGGGITGAAVARDAAMRGLRVALVDREDFAWGTSSRSSKLIHGGLRYLENMEFGLVFESLSERAFLLESVPQMVRPLPFYFPVYAGDKTPKWMLGAGMWLYDLLAVYRSPKLHKGFSKESLLAEIPVLRADGLQGGFRYFDASMWDDALTIQTLRSAHQHGAVIANYVEAVGPLWTGDRVTGFRLRDREKALGQGEIDIRAHQVVLCGGPWTDQLGQKLSPQWKTWLAPSRGIHLVFDAKRLPVPGAVVMSNPEDGRISFVMPRADLGAGVVIVGTTDGPSPADPATAQVDAEDVNYLMKQLNKFFPSLNLKTSDILSAYIGVRPLVGGSGDSDSAQGPLQKVSREHRIDHGPGGTIVVAGGKYTTHRKMAEEIVNFTLEARNAEAAKGRCPTVPREVSKSRSKVPLNMKALPEAVEACRVEAARRRAEVAEELLSRYGAEALEVLDIQAESKVRNMKEDPQGFPLLAAQLRFTMRTEMVLHLEDFYLRRTALFLAREDGGLPWAEPLARVWADEMGLGEAEAQAELERLKKVLASRSEWKSRI